MNEHPVLPGLGSLVKPFRFPSQPYEYKVTPLKEAPTPEQMQICDTPARAADYWRLHIPQHPQYDPERECLVILLLNTRRRAKGHQLAVMGTHDTLIIHPITVFRLAIMASAPAIVIFHNHPSGDPSPSDADVKITRDLIRAGQILKIELVDHIVIGNPGHVSMRELGYFTP